MLNNLFTAIMTKIGSGDLYNSVDGQIYLDDAPQTDSLGDLIDMPYIIFSVITSYPDKTFSEYNTVTEIQFSIYSDSEGVTEISGIYNYLNTLFDECTMTITGSTLVWARHISTSQSIDQITSRTGRNLIRRWDVQYEFWSSLN